MRSTRKDHLFSLGLGLAILSVLAILAILQYRWSNQVSEANQAQIGANLRSLMTDWHFDLFREFSGIAIALQVGPDSGARDDWHDYLARYREWQDAAPAPEMVEDVFIWESSAAHPRLLRLNSKTARIEPAVVPQDCELLLQRLRENASSLNASLWAWTAPNGLAQSENQPVPGVKRNDIMTGWQFDANLPAVAHPIVHHKLPGGVEKRVTAYSVDWIVVTFSPTFIRDELLPQLTSRYFFDEHGLEYRVALVEGGGDTRTIYSSEASEDNRKFDPDAQMSIFGVPPESAEGRILEGSRPNRIGRDQNWRSFSGPPWFPVINYGQPTTWTLMVQHRQGSVAEMIAGGRRRNLAISFGVLGLLAVSMSLVVIAAYRAQRFARLQMNFVAGISHELRTPLAVISSAAENIADGVVGGKQLAKYSSAIRNQSRQITRLVEQILNFAARRDGQNQYQVRPIEVGELIHSAVESTKDLIDREGFSLELNVEANLPKVEGDLSALLQCVQNLIVNAVKYGGQRWVGIRASTGNARNGSREVLIAVEDRGSGIPHRELEQIFQPFYRTQAAREAQVHGTGLGLTLARTIAEDMGGSITVRSKPGHGSAFTLHLPAFAEHSSTAAPTSVVESMNNHE